MSVGVPIVARVFLLDDGTIVYSASDLAAAADCELALLRVLDGKLGRSAPLDLPADAMLERAARLGDRHEARVLTELVERFGPWDRAAGTGVVEIERPDGRPDRALLAAKREETLDALRAGADVVFQAGFFDGRFSGWADFLVREDSGRYSVYDTKLARHAKVTALLQLAAYADQLLAAGLDPDPQVHLLLGDRTRTSHRLADLLPVYRDRRARLEAIVDGHQAEAGPVAWGDERYRACLRCAVCAPELAARRDVLLVAGLRVTQRARLRAAGIATIDALAVGDAAVAGIGTATVEKLRAQARLQVAQQPPGPGAPGTAPGAVRHEIHATAAIAALPAPDPGDVFFDFEGDPLWSEDGGAGEDAWGLEYLFGVVEAPTAAGAEPVFRPFWAHDRAQEKQALEDFLAYVTARRAAHPGMRVYHYAAYEKTALLRLAGRHGVGEDVVDQLLREGVLVDLYATVRASLRTSQDSYSLKKLEPLYMPAARAGEVTTAGDSIVEYAEACERRDAGDDAEWQRRLGQIAAYNRVDCLSTLRLRDWLLAEAARLGARPGAPAAGPDDADAPRRDDLADRVLVERLLAVAGDGPARDADDQALALLAAALGYHRREAKPFWWAHYDRLSADPAEWTDARNTFVADEVEVLEPWGVPPGKRVPVRLLRMVGRLEPGSELTAGATAWTLYDAPLPGCLKTSTSGRRGWGEKLTVRAVDALDDGRDVLVVEEGLRASDCVHDAVPMALVPACGPSTTSLEEAVRGLAERVVAALPHVPAQPALDLLRRVPPRLRGGAALPVPRDHPDGSIEAITAALRDLDGSYLAVQGPPGTGKTFVGSRVIARLVEQGWRVGVVAQSHAVVENMLHAVASAGVPADRIGKKAPSGAGGDAPWTWVKDTRFPAFYAAQPGGLVVGGTAWDFTNPKRLPDVPLDLLVVDEAGQFSLANTLAVSTAARNLLLLGDPQQLPQVSQGRHPEPVDRSALGWLTDGHDTLPESHGYFLARTWRMHPDLCAAVSRLSYEDRLRSMPCTAERSLEGVAPGVRTVAVVHEGNAVASREEAAAVVGEVRAVLGRRWQDPAAGEDRPLGERDVLVVAAYNAQVWTVRRALAAAGLGEVRVGTVDKFQGQQAPVVIVSLAASTPEDVPRGMEFLLSRNRVNVAVSRGQWCAVVVRSPALTDYLPNRPERLEELGAFLGLDRRH